MNLKDVASISGKGGLFKVVKPTRNGVILETLDKDAKKVMAGPKSRVSILNEISIYTTDNEGSVPLEKVMKDIQAKENGLLKFDPKTTEAELRDFILEILPNYDEERVYASDLKKLVSWYNILFEFAPEIFKDSKESKEEKSAAPKKSPGTSAKKVATKEQNAKKPAAKKATTPKPTTRKAK